MLEWLFDFIFSNLWFIIIIFWFLAPLFRGGKGKQPERRRNVFPGQPGQQPGRQPSQPDRQPGRQFDRQPGRQLDQPNRTGQFGQPGQSGNWQGNQQWEQQRQANAAPQRQASQPRRDKEFGWPGKEGQNPFPFPMFPWEEEEWQFDRKGAHPSPVGQTPAQQKVENPTVSDVEEWYPPFVMVPDADSVNRQDNREEKRKEENRHSDRLQPDKRVTQTPEQAQEGAATPFPHATDLLPSANQAVQGMIWSQIFGPPKGLEAYRSKRYNSYTRRR